MEVAPAAEAAPTPVSEVEAEPPVPDRERVEQVPVAEPEYPAARVYAPEDHATHLALARTCLREGNPDVSALEYEQLVKIPSLVDTLIQDLERAVESYPEHHALRRVLGDAYMRNGQLQKALQAYREALSKL
jgi:tetratricopeptide (TPR) repeat protein